MRSCPVRRGWMLNATESASQLVSALQISEFDELVMKEVRIAICDEQVAFALFYRQRRQQGAIGSGSEDDAVTVQDRSVG